MTWNGPRCIRLQSKLDEQVKQHFPDEGVQRVALLQHGDDPEVEPGGLWVRVFVKVAGIPPDREGSQARIQFFAAWRGAHEAMLNDCRSLTWPRSSPMRAR